MSERLNVDAPPAGITLQEEGGGGFTGVALNYGSPISTWRGVRVFRPGSMVITEGDTEPVLLMEDHDRPIIGKARLRSTLDAVVVDARFFADEPDAQKARREIAELAPDGLASLSLGLDVLADETPTADEKALGAEKAITSFRAREVSYVPLGADPDAKIKVAMCDGCAAAQTEADTAGEEDAADDGGVIHSDDEDVVLYARAALAL